MLIFYSPLLLLYIVFEKCQGFNGYVFTFNLSFKYGERVCHYTFETNDNAAKKYIRAKKINLLMLKGFAEYLLEDISQDEFYAIYDKDGTNKFLRDKYDCPKMLFPEVLERYLKRHK